MLTNDIQKAYIGLDPVDKVYLGENEIYEASGQSHDYSAMPLTIQMMEDGKVMFFPGGYKGNVFQNYGVSINGGSSDQLGNIWTGGGGMYSVSLSSGDTLQLYGNNCPGSQGDDINNSTIANSIATSGASKVYGNICSLIDGDNFTQITSLQGYDYAFYGLFNSKLPANFGITNDIVDATNLILAADELSPYCYGYMFFAGGSNVTPVLTAGVKEMPAMTLADSCYRGMYRNQRQMVSACTELPATQQAVTCYSNMFRECTSLTVAPYVYLTAIYGTSQVCGYMYASATSLSSVRFYATYVDQTLCIANILQNTNGGTFERATGWPQINVGATGNGVPRNWTQTSIPPE